MNPPPNRPLTGSSGTDTIEAGADVAAPATASVSRADTAARVDCFHCGEPCAEVSFRTDQKHFCCQGCRLIHELLTENGLGHFYDLSRHPGTRARPAPAHERWTFLDDESVRRRLLDFSDARISKVTFRTPAIHCVACVWLLENLFRLHPGIGRSQVDFLKREVAITFATGKIKLSELAALLCSIGYEPSLTLGELDRRAPSPARRRQWLQVGIAGFAFGNVMLFSLPRYLGLDNISGALFERIFGGLSLALAAPVLIYSASDYWMSAWRSFRQRQLTLDVPIALGLAALYAQSALEIFSGRGEGYLDSLCGLIFLLLIGRVFQQKTHDRLAFDRDYKSFFPLSVIRIRRSRREEAHFEIPNPRSGIRNDQRLLTSAPTDERGEERISMSQLQVGDHVILRNGELIPADAVLIGGPALIDYSFVTGESEPAAGREGDYLYAGGKQIGAAIELETVKPVSQSYLTSLWNHAAFQKSRENDLNTLTNRYSRHFTRLVLAVAAGAALFWLISGDGPRALKAFTSVLIVACPCALALAAPFTFGTAQRLLARAGVFVKNAGVLERLAEVNTIVFDKTGTLTAASARSISFSGAALTPEEQRWIGSLARHSTHPFSARISEALTEQSEPLPVNDFCETPGSGIEGVVRGHRILLGSPAWLETRGVNLGQASRSSAHVAIDGRYQGAFVLSNTLRPEADRLLLTLSGRYELALLSGDHEGERERFRGLFARGTRLQFNQSPVEKLEFIRKLQDSGRSVMMIGDGLNDAGALKQSDVGAAVVEQVGGFSPASDLILAAPLVPRLGGILTLARNATRIVRSGLAISAVYNVLGISIAAAGILSPMICAILMPLSSLTVVLFACGTTAWAAEKHLKGEVRRAKGEPDAPHFAFRPSHFPAS